MPYSLLLQRARTSATLALICLLAGLVTACGGSNPPVTLTFWSWVPNLQQTVDLFQQAYPDIRVKLQNVGTGLEEYSKLTTALRDGSRAPDVVQIEYAFLPQYEQNNSLVDLSAYGANDLKSDFVPWAWGQVSQGNKVYAIPQDSGPMGLLYRADIFHQYHLNVPTNWMQYEQETLQIHQENSKIVMTNFAVSDGTWFIALTWQAGSQPFKVNGKNLTIHLDDAPALQVANYWDRLVKEHLVSTLSDRSDEWYADLNNGTIASWVTAAWAPTELATYAGGSAGSWRVAPMPQWADGARVSANWGGSTDAVTTQSRYPKQAAEFAEWLNTNAASVVKLCNNLYLFPTQESSGLSDPVFMNARSTFYGGQPANQVFAQSSQQVNTSFQWSPFESYVVTQLQIQLALAVQNNTRFEDALHNTQSIVVSYAKSLGFTVNS